MRTTLAALAPQRRGQTAVVIDPAEFARLRQENERLTRKLATAEAIIETNKVTTLLGLTDASANDGEPQ